jgi:predicted amidohydrolase YtcJ
MKAMGKVAAVLGFAGLLCLPGDGQTPARPAADLIVTNAQVWTVDREKPRAEAVAVIGERVVAVGSAEEIDAWRGTETRVLDAMGKLLLPGFNDAHVHFLGGGLQLDSVDLRDAATPEEFARRIGKRAKERPGEWILGGDWDDQLFDPPQLPTRQMIDAVAPETPVFVRRYDGHMAVANSAALKLAGITPRTRAPAGGEIVSDAKGQPTGVLKDAAMELVRRVIPELSREARKRAIQRALAHAASLGVTSVQEMGTEPESFRIYAELAEKGELTARIYAAPTIMDWEDQARLGVRRAFGSTYLRTGALKGFSDGSLGSSTALFYEPYTDAPRTRGLLDAQMQPPAAMRQRILNADRAGLQLCIHAIGDRAISMVLDMFEEAGKAHIEDDPRYRMEHAQHIAPKDMARFAKLRVIPSVQPYHAIDDGRWAEARIGPERIQTTYAFRSLLDAGARLALGTDWTVAPLDPMLTIYAAVTRATLDGKNPQGWVPEEKITVEEAVEAYTVGSAYAEFQEREKGSLSPGKLADMVILSDDIFSIDPRFIREVRVEATIVGGRVVWSRVGLE